MAPFAKVITVTFEKSLTDYGKKAIWIGNPIQSAKCEVRSANLIIEKKFSLKKNVPVVFIFGGGTGAEAINKLVEDGVDELCNFCQVIHSTGRGKMTTVKNENYRSFEFLNAEEMTVALDIADLVVSRAGLGALTEISVHTKPAIIIPMPNSHQEDNAAMLVEKNVAFVLNQKTLNADSFVVAIKTLLFDEIKKEELRKNIKTLFKAGANEEMIKIVKEILK
jgi:UDP-N-acetylglucosamine--N-acetylmuramyl-(pentapeptide) pyrophosphoryl-undecaprenol N-acetylglucosamine transferase